MGVSGDSAYRNLLDRPWEFEFSQAMRLLLRHSEHGTTGGPDDRRFDVEREPVRIGAHQSLGFPASDVQELSPIGDSARRRMLINFLGLTGPTGVLPQYYTEFLHERNEARDEAPAEFLDLFNHRMAMLFYYGWEKYRFPVTFERRPEHDFFRQILYSLVGLGTEHLRGRSRRLSDDFFLEYAALLAIQPRSASALRSILSDFFKVPVEVLQFAGTWYPLDDDSVTRFGGQNSDSDRIGHGVVVSEEYWSQESMVRLQFGPLDLASYRRFLGQGPDFLKLQEICRFFSRDEMVFELQLILDKDEVPETALAGDSPEDAQLGWTTWAKSEPFQQHAENVVIRL
jgi:type VI secretion system protein ImpH